MSTANTQLFTKNGEPMIFYMTATSDKKKMKSLIESHGGKLLGSINHGAGSAIILARKQDANKLKEENGWKYYETEFVTESIENNQVLELEDYLIQTAKSVPNPTRLHGKPEAPKSAPKLKGERGPRRYSFQSLIINLCHMVVQEVQLAG
jgi:hypothetical protein